MYKWHDIQKNPEDLPNAGEQIITESTGCDPVTKKKYHYAFMYRPCDRTWLQKQRAWKYIEPFEGGE